MRDEISQLREHQRRINEMVAATPVWVFQAKLKGYSWTDIGGALGISRQAAHSAYAAYVTQRMTVDPIPGQTAAH